MKVSTTLMASALLAAGLMSGTAHAALQGRDLDGNFATFEGYYDTVLNITWLADANYAKTSGYSAHGLMNWAAANTWAASLDPYGSGITGWRLPTTTDTGAPGCDLANSGTDCGYNVDPASSEMAHLYFAELGNLSYGTTSGALSGAYAGGTNPNSTLDNVGPFTNFQSYRYWSSTEYAPDAFRAWNFNTSVGVQQRIEKTDSLYALAVHDGDVGAVPEAQTYALMLAGLGLVGAAVRRRKQAEV